MYTLSVDIQTSICMHSEYLSYKKDWGIVERLDKHLNVCSVCTSIPKDGRQLSFQAMHKKGSWDQNVFCKVSSLIKKPRYPEQLSFMTNYRISSSVEEHLVAINF